VHFEVALPHVANWTLPRKVFRFDIGNFGISRAAAPDKGQPRRPLSQCGIVPFVHLFKGGLGAVPCHAQLNGRVAA